MRYDFNDKVVWITGASSGIGEALAYAFSARGAKLILSSRRADELERVRLACARPVNV
jgi:NADP-dependent 3-hydroxy acid dehydrogenase YdfG